MANHKSSKKRIRSNDVKKERNRYKAKTMRNALKTVRTTKTKADAEKLIPGISSMLDKLAKTNVIHKSKAANLKSSIVKHVNALK